MRRKESAVVDARRIVGGMEEVLCVVQCWDQHSTCTRLGRGHVGQGVVLDGFASKVSTWLKDRESQMHIAAG